MTYERAQALNDRHRPDAVAEDPFTLTVKGGSVVPLYGVHRNCLVRKTRFDGTADIHELCWSFFRLCHFAQRVEKRRQEVLEAHQTVVMWGLRFRRVWVNIPGSSRTATLDRSGEELGAVPATLREVEAGQRLSWLQDRKRELEWARDVYDQAFTAFAYKAGYMDHPLDHLYFEMPDRRRVRWNNRDNETLESTSWPWHSGHTVYVYPQEEGRRV